MKLQNLFRKFWVAGGRPNEPIADMSGPPRGNIDLKDAIDRLQLVIDENNRLLAKSNKLIGKVKQTM